MEPVNIPLPAGSPSQAIYTGAGELRFFSLTETTGSAAASVRFWDSGTAANHEIMLVTLTAGQSTRERFRRGEVPFLTSLYMQVVSGSIEGSVTLHFTDCDCPACVMPVVVLELPNVTQL